MGFRQNNDLEYKKFIRKYQQELLQLGLPLRTLDAEAWNYFLAHGDCIYTDWKIDGLSRKQAQQLLQIVEEYDKSISDTLVRRLKTKLKTDSQKG